MNKLMIYIFTFTSSLVYSHTRLLTPTPRSSNSGIKNGPCGGLARSAVPTNVMGGTMMTVTWQETIDHPGKYILSFSTGQDLNFQQNVLATIIDTQDGAGGIPHMYSTQVMIPNIDCTTCTIQLIQSMEENPAAPSYYYSCADLNIQKQAAVPPPAPAPTPTPGGNESAQSSTLAQGPGVKFGQGCGIVKAVTAEGPSQMWHVLFVLLMMMIPGMSWMIMRQRALAHTK